MGAKLEDASSTSQGEKDKRKKKILKAGAQFLESSAELRKNREENSRIPPPIDIGRDPLDEQKKKWPSC